MIFSIIIPTYNEEEYLPTLLDSIKKQNFDDYEIIIADANSTDRTREIAEEYGCIIVDGGMPAVGRNNGAKVAKGDYLLFLDSDLKLTDDYLRDVLYEFQMERLGIAITQMKPLSKKSQDKIWHNLANLFMVGIEKIKPHGAGCYGIIVKRELHEKCGGFDEELNFGEDSDYINRLGHVEQFNVLRKAKIGVSTRRLEEEGIQTLIQQYGKSTWNDFVGKPDQIFRFTGENDRTLFIISVIQRPNPDRITGGDEFTGLSVKEDHGKFRVQHGKHICSIFLIQWQDDLTVAVALEGISKLPQFLPLFFKTVQFSVADNITAIQFKRLHSFRMQAHDLQTMKGQKTFSGIHDPAVVGATRFRSRKSFLKSFSVGTATAISHYRTHDPSS